MTREELEKEISIKKRFIKVTEQVLNDAPNVLKNSKLEIADLEKQLAELEVEVYQPWILTKVTLNISDDIEMLKEKTKWNKYIDRHNAGEELKKLISEENQKQGWKVDWYNYNQYKYFLQAYSYNRNQVDVNNSSYMQMCESELYFSEQSSKDQDFLNKIKPLWLKWKGITE